MSCVASESISRRPEAIHADLTDDSCISLPSTTPPSQPQTSARLEAELSGQPRLSILDDVEIMMAMAISKEGGVAKRLLRTGRSTR
ncbi:hypothetical protein CVT26_003402 [Gymnopilus dilepis]|uniref:Uncharacterized protein n=1 Tax=Gymnopilus dilepis TaxID=231916 RepID=A0A409Y5J9_9AGAR|nr:hypothetical protein CVT26_003402 [Gymnopilus dilepis]